MVPLPFLVYLFWIFLVLLFVKKRIPPVPLPLSRASSAASFASFGSQPFFCDARIRHASRLANDLHGQTISSRVVYIEPWAPDPGRRALSSEVFFWGPNLEGISDNS